MHAAIWTNTFSNLDKYSRRGSLISDLIIHSPQCWAPLLPHKMKRFPPSDKGILLAGDNSDKGILFARDSADKNTAWWRKS